MPAPPDPSVEPQKPEGQPVSDLIDKPRVSCDVDPENFEPSFEGFEKYIEAIGARRVSAKELLTPHNRGVADDLGYYWLLPDRATWANLVPLIDIFEIIRDAVDAPIVVRNWWRPADYNAKVGGAPGSDHITGHAFDCDFKTHDQRRVAERCRGSVLISPSRLASVATPFTWVLAASEASEPGSTTPTCPDGKEEASQRLGA